MGRSSQGSTLSGLFVLVVLGISRLIAIARVCFLLVFDRLGLVMFWSGGVLGFGCRICLFGPFHRSR